jgi:tRNA(Ile)-lysidine synthase
MASDRTCLQIERRVCAFVIERELLQRGQKALLMLSGGADSMALLTLVLKIDQALGLGLTFQALHVDYAMRGADSDRDRQIVAAACAADGVPLHVVRRARKLQGANFQERARELRYGAAEEIATAEGLDAIVTAHNRDDQAETVLYRLAKYAAPLSAAGMRAREGRVVRPLLTIGAAEIRDYCHRRGIVFGEDVTNAAPIYARNVIRLAVLPALEAINPHASEALARSAEMAALEGEIVAEAAAAAWARVAPANGGALDTVALAAEPAALRALCVRRLLRIAYGPGALIERRIVGAVEALAAGRGGSASVTLGKGYEAVREYDRLVVRRQTARHECAAVRVTIDAPGGPGPSIVFCGRRFALELLTGAHRTADPAEAYIGLAAPPRSIAFRHPRRGEHFAPLGMTAETSIAAFLKNAKVPAAERSRVVVVEVDGAAAWLVPAGGRAARVAESRRVIESSAWTLHIVEEAR